MLYVILMTIARKILFFKTDATGRRQDNDLIICLL